MAGVAEFDIVRPQHVDRVLFENVISCYPYDKDITANYILGQDVTLSSWNWIGIYRRDWRYTGEYLTYNWVQTKPLDCTAPRRRTVVFPSAQHRISPNDRDQYQLIYVASGNHVVGVSGHFKVTEEQVIPDCFLAELFREPSVILLPEKTRARKAPLPSSDTYEVINELACPSVPKRRAKTKQKVIAVYRDTESLVNLGRFDLMEKLRFVHVHPTVQEYNQSNPETHQNAQKLQISNVNWAKQHHSPISEANMIEYPMRQKIKVGPMSFLMSLKENEISCSSCQVAKSLVEDLVERDALQAERMRSMTTKMNSVMNVNTRTEEQTTSVGLLDLALGEVHEDNTSLRQHIDQLEELIGEARSAQTDDDLGTWIIRDPKRIARIKKVVGRQSRTIHVLRQCNENKQRAIIRLQDENNQLRKLLQAAFNASNQFREIAEEYHIRIKAVLSERANDHTNEWRQFVRTQENTTQTIVELKEDHSSQQSTSSGNTCASHNKVGKVSGRHKLKNKQISKILKSEKRQQYKLRKEQAHTEECPTCGLKFSIKADHRVIDEHIEFHERMKS